MEEDKMSDRFKVAFSLYKTNNEQAIQLLNEEINDNPSSIAAWNNRGMCKLELAKENKDKVLLQESKEDFKKAIKLMEEKNYKNFPTGTHNHLKEAEETKFD